MTSLAKSYNTAWKLATRQQEQRQRRHAGVVYLWSRAGRRRRAASTRRAGAGAPASPAAARAASRPTPAQLSQQRQHSPTCPGPAALVGLHASCIPITVRDF
ncbi:hypothetical protein EVAR_32055_1 [Eumeta japonica]|uniref:Uncharacterized protein n=1 Tax=Eumeta variegata TaxID=151549 RepID=A0A4C1WQ92_EUMVA|nr:hypothetical protein EVAR_32055_1 [Eumeta japonica]